MPTQSSGDVFASDILAIELGSLAAIEGPPDGVEQLAGADPANGRKWYLALPSKLS